MEWKILFLLKIWNNMVDIFFFKQKDLQTVFLYMHLNVEIRVFQYLYQSLVLECWKTVNFFPLAFLAIYLLKKSPSLLKVIAI